MLVCVLTWHRLNVLILQLDYQLQAFTKKLNTELEQWVEFGNIQTVQTRKGLWKDYEQTLTLLAGYGQVFGKSKRRINLKASR